MIPTWAFHKCKDFIDNLHLYIRNCISNKPVIHEHNANVE